MHVIDLEGNAHMLQVTTTKRFEINKNEELSFRILPTKVNMPFINDITEYWTIVDHDDMEHKVIYFKKKGEGDSLVVDIKAIPVWVDDLKSRRIYERYDRHMTAFEYFRLVLEGTGYHYVLQGAFDAVQWEGLGEGDDKASMFANGLNRYEAEFELIDNTFYIDNIISWDAQFMYRHKLNASNIVLENDATQFYTYARGYGDYGDGEGSQDWQDANLIREYTSPLAPIFGIREAPPIKNGNITTVETMDEQLKKIVDDSLMISVTASIHDLREQGYPAMRAQLGYNVPLIDDRINFRENLRIIIIEEKKDWKGNVIDINVTFGVPGLVERHQSRIKDGIDRINRIVDGRESLPINVLPEAIKRASEALLGALTELEISELGIIARSLENENHLVIYNSAGLGVSTDGGATFENAITYLGVNTNLLTAGDIHTNNIRIIGTDNYFFWDGNAFTAIDPNNPDKRLDITAGMLDIKHGAISIERPDGFKTVMDGYLNQSFSVFPADPPFRNQSIVAGRFLRNDSNENEDINFYTFRHEGRYLNLHLAYYMQPHEQETSGGIYVVSSGPGNPVLFSKVFTNQGNSSDEATFGQRFTVDLGIPTGNSRAFYLQFRTGRSGVSAYARVIRIWQEG